MKNKNGINNTNQSINRYEEKTTKTVVSVSRKSIQKILSNPKNIQQLDGAEDDSATILPNKKVGKARQGA
jgi:hypothetical protein